MKFSGQQPSQSATTKPSTPPHRASGASSNLVNIILGGILFVAVCFFVWVYLSYPACIDKPGEEACLHILFIGNSYTYVNDLPGMFAELARAGGHKVETGMAAEGGWTLDNHANSSKTLDRLKSSKWDFVVLQEQSQIPASEQSRTAIMYPAARWLVRQIEEQNAAPIFFMTWAHRDGWPENGIQGYENMQFQIDQGYLRIAQELGVRIAPAGAAWLAARQQYPTLDLWQADGSHPNEQGTYLAACVFYVTIFRQTPEGLSYMANLPQENAHRLQTIAANIALQNPSQWNIP